MFRSSAKSAALFAGPAMVLVAILSFIPNVYSLYLAFTNYSIYHFEDAHFVGMRNFIHIFTGREAAIFARVFGWTMVWATLSVVTSLLLGLVLAMVLNQPDLKGKNIYRTLFIVPWAIPAFISVMMWKGLFNTRYGSINLLLKPLLDHFHIGEIDWLHEVYPARVAVLVVNMWLAFPFMMTVILGALQSIPSDQYEAASVDGASKWKQFFSITVPSLRSAMLPVIISSFAFNFNQFGGIYLLTQGGPPLAGGGAGGTDILVTYSYTLAFTHFLFGTACAYAVIIFLVIGTLSAFNFKLAGVFKEV